MLLTWPSSDPAQVRKGVAQIARALEARMLETRTLETHTLEIQEWLEWIPGLDSLALLYDPARFALSELEPRIVQVLEGVAPTARAPQTHAIPACYHPELAPDLLEVAARCGLAVESVIEQHTAAEFEVALLGFAPGFAYLEGLPDALKVPRRASPRLKVPAGSVALGGAHCGIYPLESAGGWQLIGRTPLVLLDLTLEPPGRLQLGDRVRFEAISLEDFRDWLRA